MYITLFAILMALFGVNQSNSETIDNNQITTSGYNPTFCSDQCVFDEHGGEITHIPPRP